jgi:SAM-dependent methyltransferase
MTPPGHRDYFKEAMAIYPKHAAHALWRAVELRLLGQLDFGEPILDVGCGEGEFARILFGQGKDVTGVDLDTRVLRLAGNTGAYRQVVRADVTRLPFPDSSFGSALSNCVLEHIPDDEAVVREIGRVVRPGGLVAITVPAPQLKQSLYIYNALRAKGRPEEAEEYLTEYDQKFAHLHYRTAEEWTGIFAAAGMDVERCEGYLPASVVSLWNRLDTYLMQPIAWVRSYAKVAPYILTPAPLRRWLLYRFLRKYYLQDVAPGEAHGCWLIVARRR